MTAIVIQNRLVPFKKQTYNYPYLKMSKNPKNYIVWAQTNQSNKHGLGGSYSMKQLLDNRQRVLTAFYTCIQYVQSVL